MFKTFTVSAALALVMTNAAPAAAVVKVATYTGIVSNSHDALGLFGPPGGSFDGSSFIAKYIYDTSVGQHDFTPGVVEAVGGGSYFGVPSPVYATLQINGFTYNFVTTYYGVAIVKPGESFDHVTIDNFYTLDILGSATNSPALLASNFSSSSLFPASGTGSFQIPGSTIGDILGATHGDLNIATYSVTDFVPEPASWALMIAGFTLTGVAMRRRPGAFAARASWL